MCDVQLSGQWTRNLLTCHNKIMHNISQIANLSHGRGRCNMENLLAARLQMAVSLGFHMVFAALGIGMPLLMLIAEGLWLRGHKRVYLDLARKWARATGILFAIAAVSGTALSFELGLLWPSVMQF